MRIVTASVVGLLVSSASTLVSCGAPPVASEDAPTADSQETETVRSQDVLRGSITPERAWWDVLHYDLSLEIFPETKSLRGSNVVSFKTLAAGDRMQVDLQPPLQITRISHRGANASFEREGNVYWIQLTRTVPAGELDEIQIFYGALTPTAKWPMVS